MIVSEVKQACPYCGESLNLLVDDSELDQNYIEDCMVCCRPIQVCPYLDHEGNTAVRLFNENEVPGT